MIRTFRYPLYPNQAQEAVLESWRISCQRLYNDSLQERKGYWALWSRKRNTEADKAAADPGYVPAKKPPLGYNQQTVELTVLRAMDPELAAVPLAITRSPLRRVQRAYENFFRRVKAGQKPGFPRFKSRDRYDSFSIGVAGQRISDDGRHVLVPKLGPVRFHQYRPLKGEIRDVVFKKESDGKWFVCFQNYLGAAPAKVAVRPDAVVGIDMGLTTFATLSDGTEVPNPRFGRNAAELLARRQRSLAQKKRGSASRRRQKRLVRKASRLIHNQRLDHARKLASFFCKKYDLIAHEDLEIARMVRGNLAKSINDAAWGLFLRCLACKAEEAGKWVIPVDPRGTSQRCSQCGATVDKDLSVRVHDCPHCGLRLGRDLNAALNVLALGRSAVARGDPGAEVSVLS